MLFRHVDPNGEVTYYAEPTLCETRPGYTQRMFQAGLDTYTWVTVQETAPCENTNPCFETCLR